MMPSGSVRLYLQKRSSRRDRSSKRLRNDLRLLSCLDFHGTLGMRCFFWSLSDWDAPQYQPTEEPNFIASFGEGSPDRSHKFYGSEDKDAFSRTRSEMVRALPLPRRFVGKIYGPKGVQVHQCWHTGNLWQPNPADRWEDYRGYVIHTL